MSSSFFQEHREQSIIKSKIVSQYFSVWTKVILATQKKHPYRPQKMAYVDLFAGPGRYENQSKSTPLMVLETILNDKDLRYRMITLFNDKDSTNIKSLETEINKLKGIEKLRHKPAFYSEEIGDEVVKIFKNKQTIPTFFFVDPWGYKGLSLNLVSYIIKDWGCDCVFFFNYNRINMGINNDAVRDHMTSLFGEPQLKDLQLECNNKSSTDREVIVIQALCEALKNNGTQYVLPFRFKNNEGTRTSHHLIFISKNFLGYEIMKDIMYKESTENMGGIASFEYNPIDAHYKHSSLFNKLSEPLDRLGDSLLQNYKGKTIDFMELYQEHSVDRPFIKKNYQDVFKKLLKEKKIIAVNRKTGKPPVKGTFSVDMRITFKDLEDGDN